jgi:tetratricopeptide (TPR) repeat protein
VARFQAGVAQFQATELDADELERLGRAAISLLQASGDDEGLRLTWSALTEVANQRLQYSDLEMRAEQAAEASRRIGAPVNDRQAFALALGPRPADQALQIVDSLLNDVPDPAQRRWRSWLLAMLGHFTEARAEATACHEQRREMTGEDATGMWILAEIATLAGDYATSAAHLREMCASLEKQRRLAHLSTYVVVLGDSLCNLGHYEEAEPLAKQGRDLGAEDDIITQALWRQVQARVLAHRGEHVGAERLAREAVALMESSDSLNWKGNACCDLAEVLEKAGKREEAVAALEQAQAYFGQKKNLAMTAQVRERLRRLSSGAAPHAVSEQHPR